MTETAGQAVSQWMEDYGGKIYGLGLRLCGSPEEAEDLVQETFLQAFRNRDQFEGRSSRAAAGLLDLRGSGGGLPGGRQRRLSRRPGRGFPPGRVAFAGIVRPDLGLLPRHTGPLPGGARGATPAGVGPAGSRL